MAEKSGETTLIVPPREAELEPLEASTRELRAVRKVAAAGSIVLIVAVCGAVVFLLVLGCYTLVVLSP